MLCGSAILGRGSGFACAQDSMLAFAGKAERDGEWCMRVAR